MPITGTTGNDTLIGTPGEDVIFPNGGIDTVQAGDGNDEIVITANVGPGSVLDGGLGFDTLVIRPFPGFPSDAGPSTSGYVIVPPTAITGVEAVRFESVQGSQLYVALFHPVITGGLTTLVGGAGNDFLLDVVFSPGTYTMVDFSLVNWTNDIHNSDYDTVQLRVSPVATGDFVLQAREGLASVQGLYAGAGNDILYGSSGSEFLSAAGGVDRLYGFGGDDVLSADTLTPFGQQPFTRSYAGDVFDGGDGIDVLAVGGSSNLVGATITGIEQLALLPFYPAPGPGGNSRAPTVLTLSADQVSTMLPANLQVGGQGTVDVRVGAGQSVNLSGWQIDPASAVTVTITGTSGNETITGTESDDIINGAGGVDTINAGGGDDAIVIDTQPGFATAYNGGSGFDTLVLTRNGSIPSQNGGVFTQYSVYYPTSLSGIEAATFLSNPLDTLSLVVLDFQRASSGLTTLIGGAGRDLFYDVVLNGGTFTMPALTLVNWNATVGDPNSDFVTLFASGNFDFTLNAREGFGALQGLQGAGGNDVLNGSSGIEILDGGTGINQLYGNGGNDLLRVQNIIPFGGTQTTNSYAGSLFDGGDGIDTLLVDGRINFLGTVTAIEAIFLEPAFAGGPGADGLAPAWITFSSSNFTFPANLRINGSGTVEVNVAAGTAFSAAGFDMASPTALLVLNGSGADDTITGSSRGDAITGGDGFNILAGLGGADTIMGGAGFDNISGGDGDDRLLGGADTDFLSGDRGNDYIDGGDGYDILFVDAGAQTGPTVLDYSALDGSGTARSFADGLGGIDTILNVEQTIIIGGSGGGSIVGASTLQNFLSGNGGNYTLTGGNLGDDIHTQLGDDTVYAGDGDDRIQNHGGTDQMHGGAGTDTLQVQGEAGDYVLTYLGQGRWVVTPTGSATANDGISYLDGVERVEFLAAGTGNTSTTQLYTNAAPVAQALGASGAEDTPISGQVSASDIDLDALTYGVVGGPAHGTLSLNTATGAFVYTPDADYFGADSFTFKANDGTLDSAVQTVNLTVTAVNDAAVIGGQTAATVAELAGPSGSTQAGGSLTVSDVDSPATFFAQAIKGIYGTLTINAAGAWTYVLNNANPAVDTLINGQNLTDAVTVQSADGTTQTITLTIAGANDPAVFGGQTSGAVTELSGLTGTSQTSGTVTVSDVDGAASFVAGTRSGLYGTLTINATGAWSYVLDNNNSAVDGLSAGGSLTDTIIVQSADGTGQAIAIAIAGANDLRTGAGGTDLLNGTAGNDTLQGLGGNDTLNGGFGADTLDGGNGVDTASYAGLAQGVTVSLAIAGVQNTGGGGSDTLISIENLTGTAQGDTLTGDSGANVLTGGDGGDVLDGGNGNDTLDGGNGIDTASFASSTSKVTVNLATGSANGAGNDTLISIENAVGSAFADTLTGSAGVNALDGGQGNDRISGGGGADVLTGGIGADTFVYTAGDSTVAASDTIADFSRAAGDRIDLSAIDAIIGGKDNAFNFVGSQAFHNVAGELRFDTSNSGYTIVQGDTNGDGQADLQLVLQWTSLATPLTLVATDFVL